MKLVPIFETEKPILFGIRFEGEVLDEFRKAFELWNDVEYLEDFFETHKAQLGENRYFKVTVEEAVEITLEDAEQFQEHIKSVVKSGTSDLYNTLDASVFKPFNKNDISDTHRLSRAYGIKNPSWLRLYGIRIASHCYVITGGAIKLTRSNYDAEHLKLEVTKLNQVRDFLRENTLFDVEDFENIEIDNYE